MVSIYVLENFCTGGWGSESLIGTFAALKTGKELVPKCAPQLILGSILGIDRSAIGHFSCP